MKKLKLETTWNLRLKLYAERNRLRAESNRLRAKGDKLQAEGDKLRAEGDKLYAEGEKRYAECKKLYAEGHKLQAEGNRLWAEGDKRWAEKILAVYGNIKIEWRYIASLDDYECELENGDIYKPKKLKATLAQARKSLYKIR